MCFTAVPDRIHMKTYAQKAPGRNWERILTHILSLLLVCASLEFPFQNNGKSRRQQNFRYYHISISNYYFAFQIIKGIL